MSVAFGWWESYKSQAATLPAADCLRCCLVLIGWDEDFGDEVFIGRRS